MALTKIGKEGITGISNSSDATAVTIDSNENVCIGVTTKNSSNNGSLTIGHTGMTKVSASASGNADELVIVGEDGSANAGMSIISNNANQGSIFFGDEDDTDIGKIVYDHSEDSMKMFTGTVEIVKLSSGATVFNNGGANMDFRIEGDADTELFFTDAGDDFVGIGHTNYYTSKLSMAYDATNSERGISLTPNNNSTTYIQFHNSGASGVGSISGNGSNTAFNTSSDYRLKENVEYDWDATTRLKQLKPARFNWIADEDNTLVDGFIAHEVSSIVPEAITGEKDAMTKEVLYVDGDDDIPEGKKVGDVRQASQIDPQGIDQSKLVPLLVKSLQEAIAEIDTLKTKVAVLESA